MRYFFAIVFFIHALISLMGFLKAFTIVEIKQFETEITKGAGVLWLLSSLLLFTLVIQTLSRSDLFWIVGIVVVVLSQSLIIWFWKDARYGTIINLILLILTVINFSMWNHNRVAKQNGDELVELCRPIPFEENSQLPPLVLRWLEKCDATEDNPPLSVRFKQKGKLRLSPDKSWISFNANQYVRLNNPSFIWAAQVGKGELMQFSGVDQFKNGKGHMNIALYGLIDVVNARGKEIDEGTAIRYLAEIVWYPWMARSKQIQWEKIDEQNMRATLSYRDIKVNGTFTFNSEGLPLQFKAIRYNEEKKRKVPWRVDINPHSFENHGNVLIPSKASVYWEYESGDFHWLDVHVVEYSQ